MKHGTRTGTKLGRLLKRHTLMSRDLESICGVSRQTVHNWRTGRGSMAIQHVALLMGALAKRGIQTRLEDFIPAPKRRAA